MRPNASAAPPPQNARGGLSVEGLRVDAVSFDADIIADVSFRVAPGRAFGLVGESGSGKTTTALALLGYARPGTTIGAGRVTVGDTDLLAALPTELRRARGRCISYVPQNPSRSLSPAMRIGRQLAEVIDTDPRDERVVRALSAAQCSTDDAFLARYPHELSGGQQQRVAIAMALVADPQVIVMDEPTTGLDVVTQARFLEVLRDLRNQSQAAIVYVSHDLSVVRNLVDRVAVMYGGRIVEEAPVDDFFHHPLHPYSRRLLEAVPRIRGCGRAMRGIAGNSLEPWNRPEGCVFVGRCEFATEICLATPPPPTQQAASTVRCWNVTTLHDTHVFIDATTQIERTESVNEPILEVLGVTAAYGRIRSRAPSGGGTVAVDDVSFELRQGECLAIVGESGSGKSTLARTIAGIHEPTRGTIHLNGEVLESRASSRTKEARRRIQIVFQDPDSSLNPQKTVAQSLDRPLRQFFSLPAASRRQRAEELLDLVRVSASYMESYPHELSGGQKQRVALARALAAEPDVLVCDEITSALDVAVQASVLTLLNQLRRELHMTMLFISHDLAVVAAVSESILIMRSGRIEESGTTSTFFTEPGGSYSAELIAAAPDLRVTDYPGAHFDEQQNVATGDCQ